MRKFTPIAMRCTKEQFEAVENKIPIEYLKNIGSFENSYLINNWCGVENYICTIFGPVHKMYKITVYETWNEKIFLEACGITSDITLTEQFIKENQDKTLKELFPDVFEVELEVGKWYIRKNNSKCVIFNEGNERQVGYGFGYNGDWANGWSLNSENKHDFRLATPEEVQQALEKEAVKRGFKDGVYVRHPWFEGSDVDKIYKPFYEKGDTYFDGDSFYYNDVKLFNKGQWAEIIPTITKQEAEEKLKCKIVD